MDPAQRLVIIQRQNGEPIRRHGKRKPVSLGHVEIPANEGSPMDPHEARTPLLGTSVDATRDFTVRPFNHDISNIDLGQPGKPFKQLGRIHGAHRQLGVLRLEEFHDLAELERLRAIGGRRLLGGHGSPLPVSFEGTAQQPPERRTFMRSEAARAALDHVGQLEGDRNKG